MINEADIEFLHTIERRRPVFTYVFFGINIVIFALMTLAGGTTNLNTMLAFGVKANELIDKGEYWRFITPVFIHLGMLHIFFNSYALWIVGPQVERLYGGARFVMLYLATGAAGVAGSYFYHPDVPSAGASGAIFGLFGVLLVFGLRYRREIPPFFQRAVGTGVLPVIIINLIIGFYIPGIDNSAHIAGLLSGMLLAAVIPFERPGAQTPAVFKAIQIGLFAFVALSFFEVARNYNGPRLSFQNVSGGGSLIGGRSTTDEFLAAFNNTQRAFAESMRDLNPDGGGKPSLENAIADVAKAIDQLKAAPSLSGRSDEIFSQLLLMMENQHALLQDVDRRGSVTLMNSTQASQNARKFRELMDSFSSWVDSEGGPRYGITLRKPQ